MIKCVDKGIWTCISREGKPKRTNFPISYTIDIGVLENGENVVIEFNDMWAIGNYGMDNSDYLSLLRQRYFEIIRQC